MAGTLRWVLADFGPLLMFWGLDLAFGLKPAIAGSVLFILANGVWRWRRRRLFRLCQWLGLLPAVPAQS